MGIEDIIEIIIIAFLLYFILRWMKNTRAWALLKGLIVIGVFLLIAMALQMQTILWLARNILQFAVIALIVFILTEDMRLPMILIDQYTPVMIILLLIVWLFDVTLIRYRKEVLAEEEEAIREQAEREAAEAAAKAEAPMNA